MPALSKSPTAPGDLPPHSCLPQTTGWAAHPTTLPIRGPGSTPARWLRFHEGPSSTQANGCHERRPSIGRGGTCPSKAGRRGSHPFIWRIGSFKQSRRPRGACGGPDSTPARVPEQQRRTELHALPRLPTAPSTSRSVWSAPACWRCRSSALLPETYRPSPASHNRPEFLGTRAHTPLKAQFHPGPGVGDPNRRPRPEDSKAPLAELLPPQAPREPVTGREPKPSPESAASLKRAGFPC